MDDALLVDGEWQTQVPADDRGLAYGDGVFRTLAVTSGQAIAWRVHLQRLAHDCARLDLPPPDASRLADEAARLFSDSRSGVLKIIVTRGSGGRGYAPPSPCRARRILSAHAMPATPNRPLALGRSSIGLARQPRLAGVKHLNRLEQVLARDECARAGVPDAYMCDSEGWVIATTMRNLIFFDSDGRGWTPALTHAGIIGATRQRLLAALDDVGIGVEETGMSSAALVDMRAAVACNSVTGPIAVSQMGDVVFANSENTSKYCRELLEKGSS